MTRLCPYKPKHLGGRACGEPLRDVGRDRAGRRILVCVECRMVFVVRERPWRGLGDWLDRLRAVAEAPDA